MTLKQSGLTSSPALPTTGCHIHKQMPLLFNKGDNTIFYVATICNAGAKLYIGHK